MVIEEDWFVELEWIVSLCGNASEIRYQLVQAIDDSEYCMNSIRNELIISRKVCYFLT